MKKYIPSPVDTSDVEVEETLNSLLEELASNTHEVWSKGRLKNGWVYGEVRDDVKKHNPCLISYDELPESEKEYDRQTALETLKLIVKLGYTIKAPEKKLFSDDITLEISDLLEKICSIKTLLSDLLFLWSTHDVTLWKSHPDVYLLMGQTFLKQGEPLMAYDVFSEGLECFCVFAALNDESRRLYVRLSQQQALALAESGAVSKAAELLHKLNNQSGVLDSETSGLLGRTYKEMAFANKGEAAVDNFKKSFNFYNASFESAIKTSLKNDAYYNGINAATVALLSGNFSTSRRIANRVIEICQSLIDECTKKHKEISVWVYASLAEAELLVGNVDTARKNYLVAMQKMNGDMRAQISMHKQATKILHCLNIEDESFYHILKSPTVLVFSGGGLDLSGRDADSFLLKYESRVRTEIRKKLQSLNRCVAYSSAACGADIIFLEEVIKNGGEINIILPFDRQLFKMMRVEVCEKASWAERFDILIGKACRVIELTQFNKETETLACDFSNRFIYGSAVARSEILNCQLECLTVWDGVNHNITAGAATAAAMWQSDKRVVCCIDPLKGDKKILPEITSNTSTIVEHRLSFYDKNVSYFNYLPLLFADVKGYSKLTERQLVCFSTFFMEKINQVFDKFTEGVLIRRTQGDGLFVVFNSIEVAADFANEVNKTVIETLWHEHGLPENLSIRISLDAGPCYSYIDPVTQELDFCGNYVNRAARLEPITPPGHVYASETFVALSNAEGISQYCFVYAGQVVLPKGHGIIPAYHLCKK